MRAEDVEPIEVWPENEAAVDVYCAMRTQWRVGFGGALGLDYNALPTVLKLTGQKRETWPELFEAIRVLEVTELVEMHKGKNG